MRDYKKFFTPPDVALRMAKLLLRHNPRYILEPSAGNGSLVRAIKHINSECHVVAFEINPKFKKDLEEVANMVIIHDFLECNLKGDFDAVIANPPFNKETSIDEHIKMMMQVVRPGGVILTIVPSPTTLTVPSFVFPLTNWAKNKDGFITPIEIREFINPLAFPKP